MTLFKVITDDAPSFLLKCFNCKHKFWVDASTHENLIEIIDYVGRRKLIEKCPNCGETGEE
ncbi:MAG: hypothetical protein ACOCZ5_03435 [bacterium]